MRLLSHNLMMCPDPACSKSGFPLIIVVERSIYSESEFEKENTIRIAKKIDWDALLKTVEDLGDQSFPSNPEESLNDEEFLRKLHRILLDVDTHLLRPTLLKGN